MWECKKREEGFTLLEILIAITLLAFISLGVIDVTDNAINTQDRTNEMNKNNLQIESALARFEWDFSQIYSPLYFSTVLNMQSMVQNPANSEEGGTEGAEGGAQGTTQGAAQGGIPAQPAPPNPVLQQYYEQVVERLQQSEHFSALSKEGLPIPKFYSPEKNIFEFMTASNRRKVENIKQSHFAWVRYGLSDMSPEQLRDEATTGNQNRGTKNLVRWLDPSAPWGSKHIDIENVKGAVLLENVETLEFSFWDYQKKKWETNLRAIQNGENVIHGVKVFISWYDSQGVKRSSERIYRTHWPTVAPQDDQAPATRRGNAAGTTEGGGETDEAGEE